MFVCLIFNRVPLFCLFVSKRFIEYWRCMQWSQNRVSVPNREGCCYSTCSCYILLRLRRFFIEFDELKEVFTESML